MRNREPETPSNTFAYFFREALRRTWVSKRTTFVAVGMIAMSLFILGAFMLVAENLSRALAQWQGKSRVDVFFPPNAQIRVKMRDKVKVGLTVIAEIP